MFFIFYLFLLFYFCFWLLFFIVSFCIRFVFYYNIWERVLMVVMVLISSGRLIKLSYSYWPDSWNKKFPWNIVKEKYKRKKWAIFLYIKASRCFLVSPGRVQWRLHFYREHIDGLNKKRMTEIQFRSASFFFLFLSRNGFPLLIFNTQLIDFSKEFYTNFHYHQSSHVYCNLIIYLYQ